MKKYCFTGSHGTGKSSAATFLAAILKKEHRSKSVKVIEENVREISNLFSGKINNPDFQRFCMIDHLHKELLAERVYDIIVCDRSAMDTLVYGLVYNITLPSEYFSLAMNHLHTFDHIFFVRPDDNNSEIANDGFRDTDQVIRNEVDKQFERMLNLWGGKYTIVKTKEIFDFPYQQHL